MQTGRNGPGIGANGKEKSIEELGSSIKKLAGPNANCGVNKKMGRRMGSNLYS